MEIRDTQDACMSCGACCAFFRVSFYWGELDTHAAGCVPHQLTEKLNNFHAVMIGSDSVHPRCAALEGTIGEQVKCSIYTSRPTPCREFHVHGEFGPNEDCNKARAKYGLPPIDWNNFRLGRLAG